MKVEIIEKAFDLENIKHVGVSPYEELLIIEEGNEVYLTELKYQDGEFIVTKTFLLGNTRDGETLDDFYMVRINRKINISKRSNIILIETPEGIKMYDSLYKTFYYNGVKFTKMYTKTEDFEDENANLVREDKFPRAFFNNEFVLETTLESGQKIYITFKPDGRVLRLYDSARDSIMLLSSNEGDFTPNAVYEDSLRGDEQMILDLIKSIENFNSFPLNNRVKWALNLRRKK